ncbi:flagellar protein FliT [Undibacterium sp. TJN25]|uniref:flagellar protein FliT n=1 Tax=Undibacterium sp. TJN25 TaxID=3413056 RepID=UPI003BF30DA4
MTSSDVIALYEHIAGLSSQMLSAARANDWASLSALEQECAEHSRAVESNPLPPLDGADRMRKIALITQILATDRQITEITEPWMAKLAAMSQRAPAASQELAAH